ncbi:MAG: hypothetical protein IJS74_03220, partial [Clostridia bacterium]|nr:hypothetical protein [Clostridia bacterium]
LIVNFKNLIVKILCPQMQAQQVQTEGGGVASVDKDVCSRIVFLAKDLKDYIGGLKKVKKSTLTKGELTEIINSLINAVKNGDYKYIKPLLLSIKAAEGKDKEILHRLSGLQEIVNNTFIDA